MPIYSYICSACDKEFDQFHMMAEQLTDCRFCGAIDSLQKQLPQINNINKQNTGPRVGEIVKKHIEEAKRDIKQEQERMMQEIE